MRAHGHQRAVYTIREDFKPFDPFPQEEGLMATMGGALPPLVRGAQDGRIPRCFSGGSAHESAPWQVLSSVLNIDPFRCGMHLSTRIRPETNADEKSIHQLMMPSGDELDYTGYGRARWDSPQPLGTALKKALKSVPPHAPLPPFVGSGDRG